MYINIVLLQATLTVCAVESQHFLEPRVVNGQHVSITNFAHSAFLSITGKNNSFVCGASVLNQNMLLTAAHCIDTCDLNCENAAAFFGNENKREGLKFKIAATKIHEKYNTTKINNDIGLLLLEGELILNKFVMRVVLMRRPPTTKIGVVAGWGLIDEYRRITTDRLHFVKQKIWSHAVCTETIPRMPRGTICAGNVKDNKYASEGDSGSALLVKDYIQIGIVSYKRPDLTLAIVVYTNVSYHYEWIKRSSRKLYCRIYGPY